MAQGLGHLDARLFWALVGAGYVATGYMLRILVRLAREEAWYRQAVRRSRTPGRIRTCDGPA